MIASSLLLSPFVILLFISTCHFLPQIFATPLSFISPCHVVYSVVSTTSSPRSYHRPSLLDILSFPFFVQRICLVLYLRLTQCLEPTHRYNPYIVTNSIQVFVPSPVFSYTPVYIYLRNFRSQTRLILYS